MSLGLFYTLVDLNCEDTYTRPSSNHICGSSSNAAGNTISSNTLSSYLIRLQHTSSIVCVEVLNVASRIKTKVYVKPTNTGLLLHYQSHVDNRYKRSLITTMLDRAYRISSDWVVLLTRMRSTRDGILKA